MSGVKVCPSCGFRNTSKRYFCEKCGVFLDKATYSNPKIYEKEELKVARIVENLRYTPHNKIIWNDTVDLYVKKIEKLKALFSLPNMPSNQTISNQMSEFLDLSTKSEFQIAFVGTIKTGKSTLINSLLGHNYASMSVTPETAALTKFRYSPKDYVYVTFYSEAEWKKLWDSRTSAADAFMKEYNELNAELVKSKWIGHEPMRKELANSDIEDELSVWSSSKRPEHYFVKEIEVGISSLPSDFPKQVVFVDTPGLSDPVAYRSEITRNYIRRANAVFVCVDAQKVQKEEIETISSVFSFSSHNKNKVYIIATHWDKLNRPIEDWKEQKEYLLKRFVGPGFYDYEEMADANIMHSAAYIYNICRDYHNLGIQERIPIMQFALSFGIFDLMSPEALNPNLAKLKELTNIDNINKTLVEMLVSNFEQLLYQDIEKKYLDLIYKLKRIAQEELCETQEIIEVSYADMKKMQAKLEEQRRNYAEIKKCSDQLTAIIASVENTTKKRSESIIQGLLSKIRKR